MNKVITIYAISQLLTTAYGLAVIESVRPIVEKRLHDKGYKKNRNSLYTFNSTFSDVAKGFIPFYYFVKALKLIGNKNYNIDKEVDREISSGKYVNSDYNTEIQYIEDDTVSNDLINTTPVIVFEKPETYKARKNDISLYDTYETPIEYITRESTKEDGLELTPFVGDNKVVEHVVVKDEPSTQDISKAIGNLTPEQLDQLINKTISLRDYKKQMELKLKDVA